MDNQIDNKFNKDLSWSENLEEYDFEIEESEDERKKKRLIAFVKTLAMFVLAFALLVFVGIAWFAMNENVGSEGMGTKAYGNLFTIEPVGELGYHAGIYDDSTLIGTYVRDKLMSEADKTNDIATWTITDDTAVTDPNTGKTTITKGLNIGNGPATGYEGGINPGSSGEIRFIITPSQPMKAKFNFYVYSYTGGYDSYGDEDKDAIELIDENSGADEKLAQALLNGHILLFKEKDNDGKYEGLIEVDSLDSLIRVMEKNYSTRTMVPIYWVWPETLAEIVLDENNSAHVKNLRGKKNICNNTGRSEVISFFKNKPQWFLLDPEDTGKSWSDTFNPEMTDEAVINRINNNYALYSSYYNEADQHIGIYVSYLFLDLNAEGEVLSNSGSGT